MKNLWIGLILLVCVGCANWSQEKVLLQRDIQDVKDMIQAMPDQQGMEWVNDHMGDLEKTVNDLPDNATKAEQIQAIIAAIAPVVPGPGSSIALIALTVWGIIERRKRVNQ